MTPAQSAETAALSEELTNTRLHCDDARNQATQQHAEIMALLSALKVAEEALEPFARRCEPFARHIGKRYYDGELLQLHIRIGDLHKASAALDQIRAATKGS